MNKMTQLADQQRALEASLAQAIAEIMAQGTNLDATLAEGSHNVVTFSKERLTEVHESALVEVQVIIKCGTVHEVRDDLWDAIINRQDMDVGATEYANAAMERLGFATPTGGWPK